MSTRRQFLRWVGVTAPSAVALAACGGTETNREGQDAGGSPLPDEGMADRPDVALGPDMQVGAGDMGLPDAERPDGAVPDGDLPDMAAPEVCELTGSDVEGPFFEPGAPARMVLAEPEEPGSRLWIEGRVLESDCQTPIANALLDIWHADIEGVYHSGAEYRLRGQVMTDDQGRYRFETIMPGRYPLGGSTRPAHIHFMVSKPGFQPLTTQLYFAGDPFLNPNDPCGDGCNSGDPTLIIELSDAAEGEGQAGVFDIVLG